MKSEKVVQTKLRSGDSYMRVILPFVHNLERGRSVTLKDSDEPDRLWEVVEMSDPFYRDILKHGWHNNI